MQAIFPSIILAPFSTAVNLNSFFFSRN